MRLKTTFNLLPALADSFDETIGAYLAIKPGRLFTFSTAFAVLQLYVDAPAGRFRSNNV